MKIAGDVVQIVKSSANGMRSQNVGGNGRLLKETLPKKSLTVYYYIITII